MRARWSSEAYIPLMECLLSCVLLLSIGQSRSLRYDEPTPVTEGWWLMQQPSGHAGIESTLAALKEKGASQSRLSEQLAHAMMWLADTDRQPRWPLVVIFADNVPRDLLGNQLTTAQNTRFANVCPKPPAQPERAMLVWRRAFKKYWPPLVSSRGSRNLSSMSPSS